MNPQSKLVIATIRRQRWISNARKAPSHHIDSPPLERMVTTTTPTTTWLIGRYCSTGRTTNTTSRSITTSSANINIIPKRTKMNTKTNITFLFSSSSSSSSSSSLFSSAAVTDHDITDVTDSTTNEINDSTVKTTTTATAPTTGMNTVAPMARIRLQILHQAMENIKIYGIHETNVIQHATIQVLQQQQQEQQLQPQESPSRSKFSLAVMGMITIPDVIQYTIQYCNEQLFTTLLQQQPPPSPLQFQNDESMVFQQIETSTIMWCIQQRILMLHDITTTTTTTTQTSNDGTILPKAAILDGPKDCHAAFIARSIQWDCISTTQSQITFLLQSILQHVEFVHEQQQQQDKPPQQQHPSPQHSATVSVPTMEIMTLSAIYVATELHFLSDTSSHPYTATWNFLYTQLQQWEHYRYAAQHTSRPMTTSSSHYDLFSAASLLLSTSLLSSSSSLLLQIVKNIPSTILSTTTTTAISPIAAVSSIPKILQYHTPSEIAFTMNVFGTALSSGLYSLLVPSPTSSTSTVSSVYAAATNNNTSQSIGTTSS